MTVRFRFAGLLGLAGLLLAGAAGAHGPEAKAVKARLDPLPAALAGVDAQVQTTVAPQLVVANDSDRTLEILDGEGRAFLRIDRGGVLADLASPAWYRGQTAARGVPLPDGVAQDAAPRWAKVNDRPHWGWFDPRLRTDGVAVPHDLEHAGRPARLADWRVPVRRAGEASALAGSFRYEPLPPGRFLSRLTSDPVLTERVTVTLAPGTVPALHLHNQGEKPVVVADARGRPWLRVGPGGSFLNAAPEAAEAKWVKVAGGPRYTWTEPRAAYAERWPSAAVLDAGERARVSTWTLPVTVGDTPVAVTGEVLWVPGERVADSGHHH
ncbi:hypothetical protein ACLD0W_09600 [Alloalcanivorax sp. C16-1]|uniref:hypothetical protein n=1 Tax=Alloalcanivorax sp. C16-1 TaxID=3390051 RepID=UPI0039705C1B